MNRPIADLLADLRRAAEAEAFPVDEDVYRGFGRDPLAPILYAGSTSAPIAFLGRDLGKDEVESAEPLVGQAGRLVRDGLARAAKGGLLTNTVPYKPPGNKEYARKVRERFRPFVAALLCSYWEGDRVITLGNVAYEWFRPYADAAAFDGLWDDVERRYAGEVEATIRCEWGGALLEKHVRLAPLPHPSPLNALWYSKFPELLDARLAR